MGVGEVIGVVITAAVGVWLILYGIRIIYTDYKSRGGWD